MSYYVGTKQEMTDVLAAGANSSVEVEALTKEVLALKSPVVLVVLV